MKSDDTSMYDDPTEPAYVRELLQAGRRASTEVAYDVERGLAKHLATIAAAGSMPTWATGAAAAKSAWPSWVGYVALPLVAAGVAGTVWWASSSPQPDATVLSGTRTTEAPLAAAGPGEDQQQGRASEDRAAGARRAVDLALAPATDAEEGARSGGERRAARPTIAARPASTHAASPRAARSGGERRAAPDSNSDGVTVDEAARTAPPADAVAANPYATHAVASSGARNEPQAPAPSATTSNAAPRAERAAAEAETETAAEAESEAEGSKKVASTPVVDESRLEREMQMLAVTQRVLVSDPERALRLAQQGEREFPGSMLSAERRQLGLLALVKLGRLEEARKAGRPFLARFPKAPWSERLRRALATGTVE